MQEAHCSSRQSEGCFSAGPPNVAGDMAAQRSTATMIVMQSPEHGYKHIQHMAGRRGTAGNIFNTWPAGGAQLQTYPIHGWPEGHSYKHIQYMAGRRGTNISNTWLAGGAQLQTYPIHGWPEGHSYKHIQYMADWKDTATNIPYPVAVAVVAFLTIAGTMAQAAVKWLASA